jgi:hypothetical protein
MQPQSPKLKIHDKRWDDIARRSGEHANGCRIVAFHRSIPMHQTKDFADVRALPSIHIALMHTQSLAHACEGDHIRTPHVWHCAGRVTHALRILSLTPSAMEDIGAQELA